MKRTTLAYFAVGLLLLTLSGLDAQAQARTGTILGTVTDPTGAVIPNASVTITNQGTNETREIASDSAGRYLAALLPVGRYTIRVNSPGFGESRVSDLVLEVQDNRTVDFTLSPAAAAEVIEVTADVVEVDTTTATLGQVIHEEQVADLPLNGRNFVQLGWLAPGVTKGEGTFLNAGANTEVTIRGSASLSIQGMRENTNDWLLDGVDNNELTAGAISILPSVDAIQEFKVLSYNYSAEYGSRSSSTIMVVTKSGTNEFHGSAFEFLRNDKLDARNFFDTTEDPAKLRRNQFGVSVGGPIVKDKAFFFANYEGQRTREGLTGFATVPTDAMHTGDFSAFPDPIFDPCPTFDMATRTCPGGFLPPALRPQFMGNIIPANRIDPIGQALIDLYPSPNLTRSSRNFASNPTRTFDDDQFGFRVDYRFGEKDRIFGRFNYDDANQFFPTFCAGEDLSTGFCSSGSVAASSETFVTEARNLALQWQHDFSPTVINQLTAGYNRVFNDMISFAHLEGNQNLPTQLGIPGANLGTFNTSGMTNIGVSGFDRLGSRLFTPFVGGTNVFHFSDNLMMVRGAHNLKIGLGVRVMQMPVVGNTWFHGNFSFDSSYTRNDVGGGSAVADLLLGLPISGGRNDHFEGFLNARRWEEWRFYGEDSWRVNPNLTLTFGLAYNYTTPQREDHDRFTNFDPATGEYLVAGVNAGRSAGVRADKNNLEPRLQFAWNPFGTGKTVFRGGYAIYTDVSANGGVQGLYMNPPFSTAFGFRSDGVTPVDLITGGPVTLATGFPIQSAPTDLSTFTGNLVLTDRDFEQGFIQQWNFNIQHELPGDMLATIAYAGTRATKLQTKGANLNAGLPGFSVDVTTRPFPNLGSFNGIIGRGELTYHGLQVNLEKRFSQGLFFLMNYTWSKALSNGPGQNIGVNQGTDYFPLSQSLVGNNADKGPSDTNLNHQFSASYLYDLPFGRGRPYLSDLSGAGQALLGNWQVSGITRLRTGFSLAMTTGFFDSAFAGVGNRPDRTCHGNGPETVEEYFDTSCFPFVFGALGNNARSLSSPDGPGQVNFDFSVLKTIPLREPLRLEFRTEFFNIFNHAQFSPPNTNASSGSFGTIGGTTNTSRQLQFALKFIF